jgi:hypothetical protein
MLLEVYQTLSVFSFVTKNTSMFLQKTKTAGQGHIIKVVLKVVFKVF